MKKTLVIMLYFTFISILKSNDNEKELNITGSSKPQ